MNFEKKKLLPVALTEEEKKTFGKVLATLEFDRDEKTKELKEESKRRKKAIQTVEEEIMRISEIIRTETEKRMVAVEYKPDRARRRIMVYRTDTGELVSEREAAPGELDKLFDDWQVPEEISDLGDQ